MIPEYINDWLTIVEKMNVDNTYKLAWGRAILESISLNEFNVNNNKVVVDFDTIAEKMLKYYWNQMFFFNLKQSPYKDREPVICKITEEVISKYKEISKLDYPIWFDKGILVIKNTDIEFYNKQIKKIVSILHENVSYRFKNTSDGVLEIYEYDKKNGSCIFIDLIHINKLKDYSSIIIELLNFKWSMLLEKFNYQPKIASKVKGISDNKLRRASLVKYKNILLEALSENKIIDFYTDEEIDIKDISIDHVIPWSYMYSDDIWNLVVTSKSFNSKKSNILVDERYIDKLKSRNKKLIEYLSDDKLKNDLKVAIDNNLVDKFYYNFKS